MGSGPTVTWSLAVKNGMPFLSETLQSIEDQTFKDFEVLAWDNGSEDGTVGELRKWIPGRLPGRVITGNPLSFAEAKASLIEVSDSEYVANIDADDVNRPERLARQVELMNAQPLMAAVSCHFQRIDDNGSSIGTPVKLPLVHSQIVNKLLDPSPLCNPAAILRRAHVLAVGNYRQFELGEDYDLWIRLATRFKLANVDITGLDYRLRADSMVRRARRENRLDILTAAVAAASGPDLFGLTSSQLSDLFQRKISYSLPLLFAIARHLDMTQPGPPRLRSKSFLRAVRHLIDPRDRRTSLVMRVLRLVATH